jgi:hypothetical protein
MSTKKKTKTAGNINKLGYWFEKVPELSKNIEPLTLLMIRTTGEASNYIRNHHSSKLEIVNSKNINLLHSIDRGPALEKLKKRVNFLRKNKKEIKEMEKKNGSVDLMSNFFKNSPFKSINSEMVAEIEKNKYVTLSGVGRIGAFKMVFPEGIKVKIRVGQVDDCLKKRLNSINKLYIYGLRFNNLKRFSIDEKEILMKKPLSTKRCYKRGKFLKSRKKKFLSKVIPIM